MKRESKETVCVIGIWHLGAVNAVGFAEKGYRVVGLEFNRAKAVSLQKGRPPLFEPGLEELMAKHLASKQLHFAAEPKEVANCDYVVIAYDSPVNENDKVDVTVVAEAAAAVAPYLRSQTPVIVTSQVPLGTSEKLETAVRKANSRWESGIVYTPENLRLGAAIQRFLTPDMLVLGANNPEALRAALELYRPFETTKLPMNLRSAEMVKHALNSFLATSIGFINEIAALADRLAADAVAVGAALKLDQRIGPKALMLPGLGFSGGTLARDVVQLREFGRKHAYRTELLDSVVAVNERTFQEVLIKLQSRLGSLRRKQIGILGLTYKPGTSTVRRSSALKLIGMLRKRGAVCVAYDPKADAKELGESGKLFKRVRGSMEAARQSDALVLVTEWPEFRELNFVRMAALMKQPVFVDTKNYLDPRAVADAGFDYEGFGRREAAASRQ